MGKDLHYSILPFIKNALNGHKNVTAILPIDDPDFYIFKIVRIGAFDDIYLVLSDDYYFGDYSYISKHPILKNGGFILIARPEANDYDTSEPINKIGVGKIGKLLGALNRNDFWNYITPPKKYQ